MLTLLDVPFVTGALLAWSLAVPPGPGNALIAQDAARRGWSRGIATGLGAIAADAVMFLLMFVGVLRIAERFPWLLVVMGAVGTLVMAKFAWDAWRVARRPAVVDADARGGFAKAFVAIVTSPFNHIWWLSAGTTLFAGAGAGMIGGFFGALVAWIVLWSWLAHVGAARIRRFAEIVGYGSAVVLALFAGVVAWFTLQRGLALA